MKPQAEANLYESVVVVSNDAALVAKNLGRIDQQMGKNKMRLYVLKGRCIQEFLNAGGDMHQLKKLMGSEKRSLNYYRAAFAFCKAYPLMLFSSEWRSVRDKFTMLTRYITLKKTSSQWHLPQNCEKGTVQVVRRILG